MTARFKPAVAEEQPQTGGSFVRNDDGSLTRVEHPPEGDALSAAEPALAELAPESIAAEPAPTEPQE